MNIAKLAQCDALHALYALALVTPCPGSCFVISYHSLSMTVQVAPTQLVLQCTADYPTLLPIHTCTPPCQQPIVNKIYIYIYISLSLTSILIYTGQIKYIRKGTSTVYGTEAGSASLPCAACCLLSCPHTYAAVSAGTAPTESHL